MDLQWAHAVAAILGVVAGGASGIFSAGWWMGRIEARMKLHFQKSVTDSEKRIEDKVEQVAVGFDETLKGLRQKINDVELDAERRFLLKNDFNDFREEYREDMRDLKALVGRRN